MDGHEEAQMRETSSSVGCMSGRREDGGEGAFKRRAQGARLRFGWARWRGTLMTLGPGSWACRADAGTRAAIWRNAEARRRRSD